jgi:hypothetical protein
MGLFAVWLSIFLFLLAQQALFKMTGDKETGKYLQQ